MSGLAVLVAAFLSTFLKTLLIALVTKWACQIVDVVSERTVIWCIALGYVLGKGGNGSTIGIDLGAPLPPEQANVIGRGLGYLLALLLLWWFLYRRNRDVDDGEPV